MNPAVAQLAGESVDVKTCESVDCALELKVMVGVVGEIETEVHVPEPVVPPPSVVIDPEADKEMPASETTTPVPASEIPLV
jgi:hypothetical protein